MGLLDAPEYDPSIERRRRLWIILILSAIVLMALFWGFWHFKIRYWAAESAVDNFLEAIEKKDFETAYGLYEGDPDWKAHPNDRKFQDYTYNRFVLDWGPQGDYGVIFSHRVDCAIEPPKRGPRAASGYIVVVTINDRPVTKTLWVEKKSKSIGLPPPFWEVHCK